MAQYGTIEGVKALLSATDADAFKPSQDARINAILPAVSAIIEEETGRVFGEVPAPSETLVVPGGGYPVLVLPKGLRSLDAITANPTWDGLAWTGGTALTAEEYRLTGFMRDGVYLSLALTTGMWVGTFVIEGVWEDQVPTVPADITYIANYLSAEIFKKQKASPAGFVGADGAVVPVRNTFREPEVKKILDKYRMNIGIWIA